MRLGYVDGSPRQRAFPAGLMAQVFNAPYLRADGYAAVPLGGAGFAAGVLRRGLQLLPVFDHSLL